MIAKKINNDENCQSSYLIFISQQNILIIHATIDIQIQSKIISSKHPRVKNQIKEPWASWNPLAKTNYSHLAFTYMEVSSENIF